EHLYLAGDRRTVPEHRDRGRLRICINRCQVTAVQQRIDERRLAYLERADHRDFVGLRPIGLLHSTRQRLSLLSVHFGGLPGFVGEKGVEGLDQEGRGLFEGAQAIFHHGAATLARGVRCGDSPRATVQPGIPSPWSFRSSATILHESTWWHIGDRATSFVPAK